MPVADHAEALDTKPAGNRSQRSGIQAHPFEARLESTTMPQPIPSSQTARATHIHSADGS